MRSRSGSNANSPPYNTRFAVANSVARQNMGSNISSNRRSSPRNNESRDQRMTFYSQRYSRRSLFGSRPRNPTSAEPVEPTRRSGIRSMLSRVSNTGGESNRSAVRRSSRISSRLSGLLSSAGSSLMSGNTSSANNTRTTPSTTSPSPSITRASTSTQRYSRTSRATAATGVSVSNNNNNLTRTYSSSSSTLTHTLDDVSDNLSDDSVRFSDQMERIEVVRVLSASGPSPSFESSPRVSSPQTTLSYDTAASSRPASASNSNDFVSPRPPSAVSYDMSPRPPSAPRSRTPSIVRRAIRLINTSGLIRDDEAPSSSLHSENTDTGSTEGGDVTPTAPRRQFRQIIFDHSRPSPDSSATSDSRPDASQSTEQNELSHLNEMLSYPTVLANERLARLRLLRLGYESGEQRQTEQLVPSFARDPNETGRPRLHMVEITDNGTLLMENMQPEVSLRISLLQAQYLQEVLTRISSLLDNLRVLSQIPDRGQARAGDPLLRTVLTFATLDPDNMSYEQLLMLDELLPKNQGASKELIANKTQILQYDSTEVYENDNCTICISDFEEAEGIRLLPCLHIYHIECIDTWLQRNKTCPMCRYPIDERPHQHYTDRLEKFRNNAI